MVRSRRGVWVGALALLVAACSGDGGAPLLRESDDSEPATVDQAQTATSATEPGDTGSGSDSAGGAESAEATDKPVDLAAFLDFESDGESRAPADVPADASVLLGGSPNYVATGVLTTALADAAIDVTGMEVLVWPVSGTSDVLLILEFDDSAAELAETDLSSDALGEILFSHPVIEEASVTRVVIRYRGSDEEGPFMLTFTAPLAEFLSEAGVEDPVISIERIEVSR